MNYGYNTSSGGSLVVTIIVLLVALVIHIILCVKANDFANEKQGKNTKGWGIACFFFGAVAFALVAAMPDYVARAQQDELLKKLDK